MCKPTVHQRKASGFIDAVCTAVTLQRKASTSSAQHQTGIDRKAEGKPRKSSSPGVLLRKLFGQDTAPPPTPTPLRVQWLDWEYTNPASHAVQAKTSTEGSDEGPNNKHVNTHPEPEGPAHSVRVEIDAGGRVYTCVTPNEIFQDTIPPPAALELRRHSWLDWDSDECSKEASKIEQETRPRPSSQPEWLSSVAKAVEVGFQVDVKSGTCTVCFDGNCVVVPISELQNFNNLTGLNRRRAAPRKLGL